MLRPEIFIQIALVLGVAAAAYGVLVRPQLARMTLQQRFLACLKPGDRVVAAGGLIGVILACDDVRTVEVEFSEGVRMKLLRTSIEGPFET